MLSKVLSAYVIGVDANLIEVEVDISSIGLPHFSVVGLPDTAVKESKDRIRPALKNIGFNFPLKKITVNLAPADLKKEGSAFDLPIAIGIIASEGLINNNELQDYMLIGELSLDGKLKPVKGVLPIAIEAKRRKLRGLIVPIENVAEAAIVEGLNV
ncbi:MAG: magnesium chelatase, partial [Thermodesulfovibrionales bacterium]|nr:magnesium chelatase [Thermodesulfovibrionales bacterium]